MLIRPWRDGDRGLVVAAQEYLSPRTIDRRFLVGSGGRLPSSYLAHIAAGPRPEWDAQVAVDGGVLCGWAEYGRIPGGGPAADLAVLVADPWQRTGLASALIRALVQRMIAAGVTTIHADVAGSNAPSRGLVRALAGSDPGPSYADGLLHYAFDLAAVPLESLVHRVREAPAVGAGHSGRKHAARRSAPYPGRDLP
ncbi:MAG TPA: GNAT family N-acetyltransferase [Dactylosporangium sp.]|jgi:GNAT superfamily N-acetyltransferase|nr:GNAT family N-acetyltransferase [Dactylosporangium sp.]